MMGNIPGQRLGRVDNTHSMNTYGFKSQELVRLSSYLSRDIRKILNCSENVKTRGQTTRNDGAIAVKLIRNKTNVQLLLESQGLGRNQEGDRVHFAKSSGNASEAKS